MNTLVGSFNLVKRPRRNRKSESIRSLVQETRLHPSDFVVPLFVIEGKNQIDPISSMPGIYRYSLDKLLKKIESLCLQGIVAIDLFTIVPEEKKCPSADEAFKETNLMCQALKTIKKEFPQLCLMMDIALDPFTSHGHDGLIDGNGNILNDETLNALGRMSLLAASSGVDIIAPSDMMDGRVGFLRNILDQNDYENVGICSYTAKYASSFYGPFRDALNSAPKFGNKKSYQMNPTNIKEALLEAKLDEEEGADMLLVKPALAYLDVLASIKKNSLIPVGAYHVSGEYAMVMAAAERGWLNAEAVFEESLLAIKRAGADFIFTYASEFVLERMN